LGRQIAAHLYRWIERGECEDEEALVLVGGAQTTVPFRGALDKIVKRDRRNRRTLMADLKLDADWPVFEERYGGVVWLNVGAIILTRPAVLRYLNHCGLDGVARLRRELKALRPGKRPTPQRPSDADLKRWMREHAQPRNKRDPLIDECRKASGATVRQAIAAYLSLPENMRLKRGEKR
jgi:hypothetical protein